MSICSWIKDKALLGVFLGMSAFSSCKSEGVNLIRPADGMITASERETIKKEIYHDSVIKRGSKSLDILVNFYNDSRVSRVNYLSQFGANRDFSPLSLYLVDDYSELMEKFSKGFNSEPSGRILGFHSADNATIYLLPDRFLPLYRSLVHEEMHALTTSENAAEANALHTLVFNFSLDKVVGAMMAFPGSKGSGSVLFRYFGQDENKEDMSIYTKATLVFVSKAVDLGGDLDLAYKDILSSSDSRLEGFLDSIVAVIDGVAKDVSYQKYRELFFLRGFKGYLERILAERDAPFGEADQLQKYFQYALENMMEGHDYIHKDEKLSILEDYVVLARQHGVKYPDLMNRAARELSPEYMTRIISSPEQREQLLKEIIDLNKNLPCIFDEFSCTEEFTKIDSYHVDAYKYLVSDLYAAGRDIDVTSYVDEFLLKFYSDGDYVKEGSVRRAFYTVLRAGIGSCESLAYEASAREDEAGYSMWICKASDFAELYDSWACYNLPEPKSTVCFDENPYIDWYQIRIDTHHTKIKLEEACNTSLGQR